MKSTAWHSWCRVVGHGRATEAAETFRPLTPWFSTDHFWCWRHFVSSPTGEIHGILCILLCYRRL